MITLEQYKQNDKAIRLASVEHRSMVIDKVVEIEMFMSESLVRTTANDKTEDSIRRYLFSNITLETKTSLFNSFVKAGVFEEVEIHDSLPQDLVYLMKLRNLLAHSMLDTTEEFVKAFDGTIVRYHTYSKKGMKNFDIYYRDIEENLGKNIFQAQKITEKIQACTDSLFNIQEFQRVSI